MIVPVMAISNLVLTQQIYSEETNGAHAHNSDLVPLIGVSKSHNGSWCQYWKLLLVFCNGWRKANRKIQGKTLRASDTFNIQEKRFKKNIIDLVLVKAFRWRIRDKTRSDHVTRNALATQNNEA